MAAIAAGEFAEFNALLASAAERGLPLEPSLALLAAQAGNARVRAALEAVRRGLQDGKPLPEALKACPEFPPDYVALVESGLAGGRLADVLRGVADYHGHLARVRARFRRFGAYLGILFAVTLALFGVGCLVAWRYDELVFRLQPKSWTQWLLRHPLGVTVLAAGVFTAGSAALVYVVRLLSRLRPGYWFPLWGRLLRSRDLALFCDVMGLRLSGGATLKDAMASAAAVLPNRYARRMVQRAAERAAEGVPLSDALFYVRWFPRTLAWSVSLAERRSDVPRAFTALGRIYAGETERAFEMLFVILTPLGILTIGNLAFLAIGFTLFPILVGIGMRR